MSAHMANRKYLKPAVKNALKALDRYWYVHGMCEGCNDEPKCDKFCPGCPECDLELAWTEWEGAREQLEKVLEAGR